MRKIHPLSFFLILTAILGVMSLPRAFSEKSRGTMASIFSPIWERAVKIKNGFTSFFDKDLAINETIQGLQTENLTLKHELQHLQKIFRQELYLTRSGVQRSASWQQLLNEYAQSIPARIIFRNASSWNSSCWVDVGAADNQKLKKSIIQKNSPVVIGYSLIGVIDYVGTHQSRIRLLTDSGLTPSVRSVRGEPNHRMLAEQLNLMMDILIDQDSLFNSNEEKMQLIARLEDLEKKLQQDTSSLQLAKGVLSGCSRPAWRAQGNLLKGTGFNCDFADSFSPARDLRTGIPLGKKKQAGVSILKEKDLLITTGMDGVFPAGLHVAKVTKVFPLKEGDFYYEIEALPIAGNLEELSLVYVLPPVGYNPDDQPPLMGWE